MRITSIVVASALVLCSGLADGAPTKGPTGAPPTPGAASSTPGGMPPGQSTGGRGQSGPGLQPWAGRMYDPTSVTTVSGQVVAIGRTPGRGWGRGRSGPGHGVHVTLRTDAGNVNVQLGPNWFLEGSGFEIQPNDTLQVKGSRITQHGGTVIVAAEISKDGHVLTLRDDGGVPLWRTFRKEGQ